MAAFKFNWKSALFVAVFLPATISLGFWQLDRADEKRQLIEKHQRLVDSSPVDIHSVAGLALENYTPVTVSGHFLPKPFLLDNQVLNGQVGYEVVQPLRLPNSDILFVSRGFVAGNLDRRLLPSIKTPDFSVSIQGYAYQPTINPLLDEDVQSYSGEWPVRVQSLKVINLYNHWAKTDSVDAPFLSSSIIRLAEDSAYSFESHWMLVNNSPEKHIAYAVQWFAMAGLLLLLFIWSSYFK